MESKKQKICNKARYIIDFIKKRKTLFMIFLIAFFIYSFSIPGSFNNIYENRDYFNSDGEFITRQFNKGINLTHQHHILYHVLAKTIYHFGLPLGLPHNPIFVHKLLSVFFGALGLVFFYKCILLFTSDRRHSLLFTCLLGVSASYWFFSATIDTYIPALAFTIISFFFAIKCFMNDKSVDYILLGISTSIAILFRIDNILLLCFVWIPLLFSRKKKLNLLYFSSMLILVGIFLYMITSKFVYNIEFSNFIGWILQKRIGGGLWATPQNFSLYNFTLLIVNHLLYSIAIPSVNTIKNINPLINYQSITGFLFFIYFLAMLSFLLIKVKQIIKNFKEYSLLVKVGLMSLIWLITRIVFYCWWDPADSFLFTVNSLPAIWLVYSALFYYISNKKGRIFFIKPKHLLLSLLLIILINNIFYLIIPMINSS